MLLKKSSHFASKWPLASTINTSLVNINKEHVHTRYLVYKQCATHIHKTHTCQHHNTDPVSSCKETKMEECLSRQWHSICKCSYCKCPYYMTSLTTKTYTKMNTNILCSLKPFQSYSMINKWSISSSENLHEAYHKLIRNKINLKGRVAYTYT